MLGAKFDTLVLVACLLACVQLALRLHPDKNSYPGATDAFKSTARRTLRSERTCNGLTTLCATWLLTLHTHTLTEVSQAVATLTDADKRSNYNQFGSVRLELFSFQLYCPPHTT